MLEKTSKIPAVQTFKPFWQATRERIEQATGLKWYGGQPLREDLLITTFNEDHSIYLLLMTACSEVPYISQTTSLNEETEVLCSLDKFIEHGQKLMNRLSKKSRPQISEWNTTCLRCGAPAYQGLGIPECSRECQINIE